MSKGNTMERPAVLQDDWIYPLETALRDGVQSYLRELLKLQVTAALGRLRYGRQAQAKGQRNGHRSRDLIGTRTEVPRARCTNSPVPCCPHTDG